MRALVVRGEDDDVAASWEFRLVPAPPVNGVLVKVLAAALSWSDAIQLEGRYVGEMPDRPFVAGHEFAGVVVDVGARSGFVPGERVLGFLPTPGAFAEVIAVADSILMRTPDSMSDIEASAVTVPYLTADAALLLVGRLSAGECVLVHSAAGGVGLSAVRLARAHGAAVVIATASTAERREMALQAGATATADYEDFPDVVTRQTAGRGVDVVIESVGGAAFDASARALAPLGRLVTIGASSGVAPQRLKLPLFWQRSISVGGVHIGRLLAEAPSKIRPSRERMARELVEGTIVADVGLVITPSDLDVGRAALKGRSVRGRVVIDFSKGVPS